MRDGLGGIERVVLIGGTSDIGLAIVRELRSLGASLLVLAGRNSEAIMSKAHDLPIERVVDIDLTDLGGIRDAASRIFEEGDVDVVVFAAGVLHSRPGPAEVNEMAVVNGAASISLLAHIGEELRTQGHGHLVVVSSIAVVRPRPSNFWYGASKVGLDFAASGLKDELDGSGVRVSVVRPGFVHSSMTRGLKPAPLAATPADVGRAVAGEVEKNRGRVVWVPRTLRYLAAMIRVLPDRALRILDR